MEDFTILKKKISYFKDNNITVHIVLKQEVHYHDKIVHKWHNGKIIEFEGDQIILDEEVRGAMPIFLEEIKDIEKRRDKI